MPTLWCWIHWVSLYKRQRGPGFDCLKLRCQTNGRHNVPLPFIIMTSNPALVLYRPQCASMGHLCFTWAGVAVNKNMPGGFLSITWYPMSVYRVDYYVWRIDWSSMSTARGVEVKKAGTCCHVLIDGSSREGREKMLASGSIIKSRPSWAWKTWFQLRFSPSSRHRVQHKRRTHSLRVVVAIKAHDANRTCCVHTQIQTRAQKRKGMIMKSLYTFIEIHFAAVPYHEHTNR